MGTETWIISLPLSDSILYLKIIHPPNFREEPIFFLQFFISNSNGPKQVKSEASFTFVAKKFICLYLSHTLSSHFLF